MPTIRQIADGKVIEAYGTSQGVEKAWDTRGRGRKAKEDQPQITRRHLTTLRQDYQRLGNEIAALEKAVATKENKEKAVGVGRKLIKFIHSLANHHNFMRSLLMDASAVMTVKLLEANAGGIVGAATHIFHALGPSVHMLVSSMMSEAEEVPRIMHGGSLRTMVDGKTLYGYGTPEGVRKAWDTRGRGRNENPDDSEKCIGPNCTDEIQMPDKTPSGDNPPVVVPHLDHLEFMMTSGKGDQRIHFDKQAMKTMLQMALVQLDMEDANIEYLNTPQKEKTDHYATIKFRPKGVAYGPLP